ncbi:MAG: SDR family oxidoreductase [Actinomycetota bacterium]|nr:SDR family oxidoreductase [Actinomycetota bacterium]
MQQRLAGKVALITGTASGMGRAAAVRFAAEGAIVEGCDLDVAANCETASMVAAAGGVMHASGPVDVADDEACQRWVDSAVARHGRVDVLYNNASACVFAPIDVMTREQWDFTIRNEVTLVFVATKAAWPHLCASKGLILNTASVAGHGGGPGGIGHSATKAAVIAMTHVMAAEGAPHEVRAVSISPGVVETPGSAEQLAMPGAMDGLLAVSLVKRVAQPDEIAAVAAFLASGEAAFITGTDVRVDGGLVNH